MILKAHNPCEITVTKIELCSSQKNYSLWVHTHSPEETFSVRLL